jgi:8-oxo-dGTP pyrophosphatase MutT (NUDIX family)
MIEKVQVWIHARDPSTQRHVLLLLTTPERDSIWQPVTGKVEAGERLEAAALREAEEETGLRFASEPEPLHWSFRFEGRFGPAEEHAFSLEAPYGDSLPKIILDPREHVAFVWLGPEQALERLKHESNKEALRLWMGQSLDQKRKE